MESDEMYRAVWAAAAAAGRRRGAAVGICEKAPMGSPHEAQNKLPRWTSAEHDGQLARGVGIVKAASIMWICNRKTSATADALPVWR
jgi:hypothetical protein